MLDIKFVRENPDAVKENIKKKFQDAKLPLVDEVIEKDAKYRAALKEVEALKAARNKLSKANGPLFGQLKKCTDEAQKAELQAQIDANNAAVKADADKMAELEKEEEELSARIQEIMYSIPQMIDPSVPIGPDDSCNVEVQRFGEAKVPDFDVPYHADIMAAFNGLDLTSARRVSGTGFYYLLGDIARLHEAVLAYARDFMINKGFSYVIPPYICLLYTSPSNKALAGAGIELVGMEHREYLLSNALDTVEENYDFILIDCPPSLELLTLNGIVAARSVLIPVQCEYYALEGLSDLMSTCLLYTSAPELQPAPLEVRRTAEHLLQPCPRGLLRQFRPPGMIWNAHTHRLLSRQYAHGRGKLCTDAGVSRLSFRGRRPKNLTAPMSDDPHGSCRSGNHSPSFDNPKYGTISRHSRRFFK